MKKIIIAGIVVIVLLVGLIIAYPTIMKMMGAPTDQPETTVSNEAPSTSTVTTIKVNGVVFDVHTNGSASLMDWFNEHGKAKGYTVKDGKLIAPDGEHEIDTKGLALEDKMLQPGDDFTVSNAVDGDYVPKVTPVEGTSGEEGTEPSTVEGAEPVDESDVSVADDTTADEVPVDESSEEKAPIEESPVDEPTDEEEIEVHFNMP